MVNRFFLVPESKYNMLLSQDSALFESKKGADSVLKDPKLTPGEKNLLYNQKLANVLKTRDEAIKRPVKVKVESSSGSSSQPPKISKKILQPPKGGPRHK